jgi:hypothetical protein
LEDELIVSNPIRKKNLLRESSRIGLDNLDRRYRLTTDRQIVVKADEEKFQVHLPLLKID